jgi:hypothetical protein
MKESEGTSASVGIAHCYFADNNNYLSGTSHTYEVNIGAVTPHSAL